MGAISDSLLMEQAHMTISIIVQRRVSAACFLRKQGLFLKKKLKALNPRSKTARKTRVKTELFSKEKRSARAQKHHGKEKGQVLC